MIIALTHMRIPNERNLALRVPEIDLMLGGHDHVYYIEMVGDVFFLKSGTDFQDFSEIKIHRNVEVEDAASFLENHPDTTHYKALYSKTKKLLFECIRVTITEKYLPDPEIQEHVALYSDKLNKDLDVIIGYTDVDLEGRFDHLRTKETNLGNLFCDICRTEYDADLAIINTGSLRTNNIVEAGPIKMKHIMTLLPMVDSIVLVTMTGATFKEVLECGLGAWPKYDGRFPGVSGFKFKFDPLLPPGSRVNIEDIITKDGPIDPNKIYRVAMKGFIADCKDGYDACKGIISFIIDGESGKVIQNALIEFFQSLTIDAKLDAKAKKKRDARMSLFNASEANVSDEGFIKISPMVDGRMVNIREEQL